jgi:hypothetical protein
MGKMGKTQELESAPGLPVELIGAGRPMCGHSNFVSTLQ